MRDREKKMEDELLVVHKPSAGRMSAAVSPEIEALPADIDQLAALLRARGDASERSRLLAGIQTRFGNAFAARVAEAASHRPNDVPPVPTNGNDNR